MENKYIGILRKIIIFLSVLLVIVCFSFGITYSNFKYKLPNRRAVQIVVNKLTYLSKINDSYANNYVIKPGNNILKFEIESNNEIDTYYKLLSNCSDVDFYYLDNMPYGRINSNDKLNIKILAINKGNENITCNFTINGGYLNNSIEDVKEDEGYNKINKKLPIGTKVIYNINNTYDYNGVTLESSNNVWKLLNINEDGSYEIITQDSVNFDNSICFNGSDGYNNIVNSLNDISYGLFNSLGVIETRNINLEDIEKYANYRIVSVSKIKKVNNIYIPSLLRYEKNISINDEYASGKLGRSESHNIELTNSNELVNQVLMTEYKINEIKDDTFINMDYYDLLIKDKSYFLSSRYASANNDSVLFGIYSVDDSVESNVLYDGNNTFSEVCMSIRPIVKLSNSNAIVIEE